MKLKWEIALGVSVVGAVAAGGLLLRGAFGSGETTAFTQDRANEEWMVDYIESQPRSSFQDELLADGELTDDEYVQAFESYKECVRAAGGEFVPDPPERNQRGTYGFLIHVRPIEGHDGSTSANHIARGQVDACNREYFDQVQQRWQVEHQPTDAEIDAAKAEIAVCVREAGVPLPDKIGQPGWGSPENIPAWPRETVDAFRECSIAAGEALGMPAGFAPIP